MKALLLSSLLIFSSAVFADTTIEFVRGNSEYEVEVKTADRVMVINSSDKVRIRGKACYKPKVYLVTAPKKYYRVDRNGNMKAYWSQTVKIKCGKKPRRD